MRQSVDGQGLHDATLGGLQESSFRVRVLRYLTRRGNTQTVIVYSSCHCCPNFYLGRYLTSPGTWTLPAARLIDIADPVVHSRARPRTDGPLAPHARVGIHLALTGRGDELIDGLAVLDPAYQAQQRIVPAVLEARDRPLAHAHGVGAPPMFQGAPTTVLRQCCKPGTMNSRKKSATCAPSPPPTATMVAL